MSGFRTLRLEARAVVEVVARLDDRSRYPARLARGHRRDDLVLATLAIDLHPAGRCAGGLDDPGDRLDLEFDRLPAALPAGENQRVTQAEGMRTAAARIAPAARAASR